MPSPKTNSELRKKAMTNYYQINRVAILVSTLVVYTGCKSSDDPSHPSVQQAASTKKEGDTPSVEKPEKQPSVSTPSAESSDDQKEKTEQAPVAPETKTEPIAKKEATETKLKAVADKTQTVSSKEQAKAGQPSTKPTKSGVVTVPQTEHVHVGIPAGLQKLLNDDSRMQPWVDQVMKVADACYASQRESSEKAAGVIVVKITMHPNARPDAEIKSLPPSLSGMVACATGGLMRTRMPLFTGPEGEQHTLRIEFKR